MSRRRRGERSPLNAEINVVSLIDVMMLLMVIFMITAPIMQGGVDVRLPTADAKPLDPKGGMVVTVEPPVFLGDERLGARLIDNVLVTRDGAERLTGFRRDLIVIP